VPHSECQEARRLLDAYLMALAGHHEITRSPRRESHDFELSLARERLAVARCNYWDHVHDHKCRIEKAETIMPNLKDPESAAAKSIRE
jgi:hypothetical protein